MNWTLFRNPLIAFAVSIIFLASLFTLAQPIAIPAILLVVVFVALYIVIGVVSMLAVYGICRLGGFGWKARTIRRSGFLLAVPPIFLLLLQSIGQLTVRDVLLTTGLAVLGYFYYRQIFTTANEPSQTVQ